MTLSQRRSAWRFKGIVRTSVRYTRGLALACFAGAFVATGAGAQDTSLERAPRSCTISSITLDGGQGGLRALCWGTALDLGHVDRFEVSTNLELDATVVELVRGDEKRVLLLRPHAQGWPQVEDIGGSLAASAGRSPLSGSSDLTIDYSEFAGSGILTVVQDEPHLVRDDGTDGAAASQELQANRPEFRVGEHIALEMQRQASAAQAATAQ